MSSAAGGGRRSAWWRQAEEGRGGHSGRARGSGHGVGRATGREREEWFALLDAWGAVGRAYREIAGWLVDEHGLSRWWAQKLVVEYEQARGVRQPGVRPDGTFAVTATKAIGVAAERLFEAVADADIRARWLPGVVLDERTARPGRSVRFDCDGGPTRVSVEVVALAEGRSQVALTHERLPDAAAADEARALWGERLTSLKALLESRGSGP